jgi:2,3-bisphosphoglycerate-dependent phosphoglycerate mutase
VTVEIVYETHAWTEDNQRGTATGWLPGRLHPRGRELAAELGRRRRDDGISAVFASDLARSVETVEVALGGTDLPVLLDWRLRECDYGRLNGAPITELGDKRRYLDEPYPGGESWRQAVERVAGFLADLPGRWADQRVLVIGHVATRFGLDHKINGVPVEQLVVADFAWREGWEYRLC